MSKVATKGVNKEATNVFNSMDLDEKISFAEYLGNMGLQPRTVGRLWESTLEDMLKAIKDHEADFDTLTTSIKFLDAFRLGNCEGCRDEKLLEPDEQRLADTGIIDAIMGLGIDLMLNRDVREHASPIVQDLADRLLKGTGSAYGCANHIRDMLLKAGLPLLKREVENVLYVIEELQGTPGSISFDWGKDRRLRERLLEAAARFDAEDEEELSERMVKLFELPKERMAEEKIRERNLLRTWELVELSWLKGRPSDFYDRATEYLLKHYRAVTEATNAKSPNEHEIKEEHAAAVKKIIGYIEPKKPNPTN